MTAALTYATLTTHTEQALRDSLARAATQHTSSAAYAMERGAALGALALWEDLVAAGGVKWRASPTYAADRQRLYGLLERAER